MKRIRTRIGRMFVRWRRTRRVKDDTVEYIGPHSPNNLGDVLRRELDYIQRNRHPHQHRDIAQRSLIGLAMSGGGIRSATSNLGVLQALSRMEILPLVDYVCTVSGGGYIGTCLSSLLSWNGQSPGQNRDPCSGSTFGVGQQPVFGTDWPRFPFRAEIVDEESRVGGDIVGHLRTHGNFLVAHLGVLTRHTMRAVGNFLTGILLNVAAFLLVLFTISAFYMALVLAVAPELPRALASSSLAYDTSATLIDTDSSVVRVHSSTCPAGSGTCEIETRTTHRAPPSLTRRMKMNAQVYGAALLGLARSGLHRPGPIWDVGPKGRFFPLTLPILLGALFATATFLWMSVALRHYLGGEAADVARLKRGESVEDVFERRVLKWLAFIAATLAFGSVLSPFLLRATPLPAHQQLLWLFVPFAFIASARITSVFIATFIMPLLPSRLRLWTRRMRSLWGAFQAISIYGWWLLLVLAFLPVAIYALRDHSTRIGFSALSALLFTRLLTSKRAAETKWWKIIVGRFRNGLLAVFVTLVVGFAILFFAVVLAGQDRIWTIAFAGFAILFLAGITVDTNKLGPHYFYRDRLAETYLLSELPDPRGRLGVYHDAMEMPLRCLHGNAARDNQHFQNTAPYHLISAAINLAGSRDLTRKDRKSGYWLFSKLFCGSVHTGFRPTSTYREGETRLARATAISGAAASAGMGRFTFFAQAFGSVLFNVRLGHWLENPRSKASLTRQEGFVFWPEYLWREVTMKTTETTRLVNLSDGGHTGDNIGIYPLLQRRCKVIIAYDAECDPGITFGSFTEALRQAYIDMGIDVDIDLTMMRPDRVTGLSRSHCAVGRIRYPDRRDQESYLIYMKNSLTGDEPEPQLNYKTLSPDFPHESTADLFFDDSQFESYRALGVHIAEDTFGPWVTNNLFDLVQKHHGPRISQPGPSHHVATV